MAAITPTLQQYVDLRNGTTIGIHFVTPVTTSDTFTVPKLAQRTTDSVSSATLRRSDAFTATITDNASTADTTASGGNTVTVAGTIGQQVVVLTIHSARGVNFGDED